MLKQFLEMVKKMEFVVLDTETTGIKNAQIVQIAIVNAFGKVLIDTLVKPATPIPNDAVKIHGISDKTVASAPNWFDVAPAVFDILHGRDVIIYNAAYDVEAMTFSDTCWGMFESKWTERMRVHCAMLHFASFRGIWNMNRGSYRWHKLQDACHYMNLHASDWHSALGDCDATRRLVLAMADKPNSGRE